RRPRRWFSLPPWVVVTATLDPQVDGRACPVGGVESKLQVLRQEGVRAVVVADHQSQLRQVRNALSDYSDRHGMLTVPAGRPREQLAEQLIARGLAWETDVVKPPAVSRRTFVAVAAAVAAGGLSGFADRRPQTLSMRCHRPGRLRQRAEDVRRYFADTPVA